MHDKKYMKFQRLNESQNFIILMFCNLEKNYFVEAALINSAKDSSGNPGLLLNSG